MVASSQTNLQSTKMQSSSQKEITLTVDAYQPSEIRSVLLTDGYHNVSEAQYIQFGIAESNSPITPQKVFPGLRFRDDTAGGIWVTVPLRQVVGVSPETVPDSLTISGGMSGSTSAQSRQAQSGVGSGR